MKKSSLAVTALGVLALALSGCMRVTFDVDLKPGGTVDGEMIYAVDREFLEMSGMSEEEFLGSMDMDGLDEDIPGARAEAYSDARYVGNRVTFADVPVDEFEGEGQGFVYSGDEFTFTGTLGDPSGAADLEAQLVELQKMGLPDPEVRYSVTFPGEVYDHNGSLSGRTVTWDLEDMMSGKEMYARGSAIASSSGGDPSQPGSPAGGSDDSSSKAWMWVLIAGALIAAAIAIGSVLSKRRGEAPKPEVAAKVSETAKAVKASDSGVAVIPTSDEPKKKGKGKKKGKKGGKSKGDGKSAPSE